MKHSTFRFTLLLLLMVFGGASGVKAAEGDTIKVLSHQETHWNWYSSNYQWSVFPDDSHSYRKIVMNYTLGCPTGGCSEWDYTTAIYALRETGEIDSTLQTYPNFTVDGNVEDSVWFTTDSTYTTFYSGTGTDSTLNTAWTIIEFADANNPTAATGLVYGFPADYWNYYYDAAGSIIDSAWVAVDSMWYLNEHMVYESFNVVEQIELGRIMTPYNGGVQQGWYHTWQFDVTDYANILHDSVQINAFYGGWQDGFTITLDFDMIEGTPPRDPLALTNIYHSGGGGFKYGVTTDPIENHLVPVDVDLDPATQGTAVHFTASGHSFGGNQNCAEFCQKSYYLKVDGNQVGSNVIWKDDCGWNPLHPQGGTWLYDRGGWCPGDRSIRWEHELTDYMTAGTTTTVDLDMEGYTYTGGASFDPNYIMEMQLIEFGAINHQNDVEVYNITAPNNDFNYSRFNPVCDNAKVVIRNAGAEPLTSCKIIYHILGGTYREFEWTGNLGFLESEEVELPLDPQDWISWWGPQNTFRATVSMPNGVADEYEFNNTMEVSFDVPPMYESDIVIWFQPNSANTETSYELKDVNGNVIWSRGPSGLTSGTIYKDTVSLADGCYLFDVVDSDGDGLAFFANNDGGGILRFRSLAGSTINNFQTNFGSGIKHYFTVGYTLDQPEYVVEQSVQAYPNPFDGNITLQIDGFDGEQLMIEVIDLQGKVLYSEQVTSPEDFVYKELQLQELASGTYFVKVYNAKGAITKMVNKQ